MLNFRNFTLGGWWKVQFLDDLDQKCVLSYKSGDYFGELALLNNNPRAASIFAKV